jgi:hypothetical protein
MGVHRIRSASVGRPFSNGNPGGGRPKGAPNKATREIKEFARNFLMSDKYQRSLERRILAGTAPHMEVLLHHYAFGKPTDKYVEPAPPAPPEAELKSRMTKEEHREMYDLRKEFSRYKRPPRRRRRRRPRSRRDPRGPLRRTKVDAGSARYFGPRVCHGRLGLPSEPPVASPRPPDH